MSDYSTDATTKAELEVLQRCRDSSWEFAKYVNTLDEQDRENPIKKFPYNKAYVKLAFSLLEREKLILVPKSRRMKMTWISVIFILWDTMFHKGVHSAVCSKKEEDADWLLENRFKFVYDNIDDSFPKHLLPKIEAKKGLLSFPEIYSKIQGFPQGADQLRMYTLSNIFGDELAFWEKVEDTFAGAKPTLEGGGRFIGVSSPAPGYFKKMVFDKVDKEIKTGEDETSIKSKISVPMEGVRLWKNEENGYTIFELHYRADPDKRSTKFRDDAKRGMSYKKYLQEYELVWDTYDGDAVYTDFSKVVHVKNEIMLPHLGLPILRGWDFGLTPACVLAQFREGKLVVIKEYVAFNMGLERFMDIILPDMATRYPAWRNQKTDYIDIVDASGFFRKDTDERTCAMAMTERGLAPKPGEINWEKRRSSVEKYLTQMIKGEPAFEISGLECPVLIEGFAGGYRYPDGHLEKKGTDLRPLKNEFSHSHDALQMITSKLNMITGRSSKAIPLPSYGAKKQLKVSYGK